MTDAPELKPCPFCGGDADLMTPEDDNMRLATAMCMGCYITGPEKETEAEAITAWNTRAAISAMGAPRVKPLEWFDDETGEYSRGIGYEYCVGFEDDANGFYFYGQVNDVEGDGFTTIEDAKAAAQAYYESRVLACLVGQGGVSSTDHNQEKKV